MNISLKKICLLFIFIIFANEFIAQTWTISASYKIGNSNEEVISDGVAYGATNGGVVTGSFKSALLSINSNTVYNTFAGTSDVFIVKYDNVGNAVWLKSFGTINDDSSIKMTFNGVPYITGYFNSTSLTIGSFTLNNSGNDDCFIAKLDINGNVLWAKGFGGSGKERPKSIQITSSNRILVVGDYDATFAIGTSTLTNNGGLDIFSVLYDFNGNFINASGFGSAGDDEVLSSLESNNLSLLCGAFKSSTLSFGTTTLINANAGTYDAFLVSLDGNLNCQGGNRYGGNGDEFSSDLGPACNTGDIIMSGYFNSASISIGGNTLINSVTGTDDAFLVGFTGTNSVQWAKAFGGENNDKISIVEPNIIGGVFTSSVLTMGTYSVNNINPGTTEVFIAMIDCAGNIINLNSTQGIGNEEPKFIITGFGPPLKVVVGGWFDSPVLTCGNSTLSNSGMKDGFILELKTQPTNIEEKINNLIYRFNLFPNPTKGNLFIKNDYSTSNNTIKLKIINTLGEIVKQEELIFDNQKTCIDLKELSQGIYFLQLYDKGILIKNEKIIKE